MYMCTSKFEIKQEELDLIKEYLSAGEITGIEEEKALSQPQEDLEPISDNEEDDILYNSQPAAPSERALGKRCRSISSEPRDEIDHELDDDDGDHPLPNIPEEKSSMQARSRRVRKQPKMPAGFEIDRYQFLLEELQ